MTDLEPDQQTESASRTPRRRQSPGYPIIDLRSAIDRTIDLYKASPRQPIPIAVAADLWGFSSRSSSSKTTAAALKRYGLVRDIGGGDHRQLALTEEGREIAFSGGDRESDRWISLIQDAALKPKIFRQVLDHFGVPLPDERVILRYLIFELGFADEPTARDFLKRFRSTLDFAHLTDVPGATQFSADDAVGVDETSLPEAARPAVAHARPTLSTSTSVWQVPEGEPAEPHPPVRPPARSIYDQFRADRKTVQIPYSNGQWAELSAAFPLTEEEWTMLMGVLQAMKPGLVRRSSSESVRDGEDVC